jgi:hypothetical protein
MWIKQSQWIEMQRRIEALEDALASRTEIKVYKPTSNIVGWWDETAHQKIDVIQLLYRILDHLGLRLEYVNGKPADVAITKRDTKKQ